MVATFVTIYIRCKLTGLLMRKKKKEKGKEKELIEKY